MSRAAEKMKEVIERPELLENILCLTDMRTLLISVPRVCRTWREIVRLKRCQRVLFLEPDQDSSTIVHNPLAMEIFPFLFDHLHLGPDDLVPFYAKTTDTTALGSRDFPSISHILEKRDAYQCPEASWRRMLIRQPPLRVQLTLLTMMIDHHPALTTGNRDCWGSTILEVLKHALIPVNQDNSPDEILASAFQCIWYRAPPGIQDPNMKQIIKDYLPLDGLIHHTTVKCPFVKSEEHPALGELRRVVSPVLEGSEETTVRDKKV